MARCEVCGNEYEHPLTIIYEGSTRHFDCFECAIDMLAPRCTNCSCKVIGHGVENDLHEIFCSSHCAHHMQQQVGHPHGVNASL